MGPADEQQIAEVCELLVRSFRELSPTWVPTVEAAREKVIDALRSGMLSRVLLIDGRVVGLKCEFLHALQQGAHARQGGLLGVQTIGRHVGVLAVLLGFLQRAL